jgi:hypothetical protein
MQMVQYPHHAIVLSVLLQYTDPDYPFGIFGHCICSSSIYRSWLPLWYLRPLYLFFFNIRILITPLVSSAIVSVLLQYTDPDYSFGIFGHCICSSSIYRFWLSLWYLQTLLDKYSLLTHGHVHIYNTGSIWLNDLVLTVWVAWRLSCERQELLAILEHLVSPPGFDGSVLLVVLIFYVVFCFCFCFFVFLLLFFCFFLSSSYVLCV